MRDIWILFLFVLFGCNGVLAEPLPAFPGAEGFGAASVGGRGGRVIEVNNLNDSGPGSLRAAIETSGPRIIVFKVSGNIFLQSRLTIRNPYVTIAGQTAPGDGITLIGQQVTVNTHDVIIRYMRFRASDLACAERDALNDDDNQYNVIIDHCTASWSVDETLTFYKGHDFTVQWCIITESLYNSCHSKGPHGYGGIWGGMNASFHHNLFAHHSSRNPRFASDSSPIDHRNNVIYNWGFNSAYGGERSNMNIINNYYKYGPSTSTGSGGLKKYRIYICSDTAARAYVSGNFVDSYPTITANNWAGGVQYESGASEATLRAYTPFAAAEVNTTTAQQAYIDVLADAGDSYPTRDFLDSRIINEVRTRGGTYGSTYAGGHKGIIDSQFDLCPNGGPGVCPECSDGDNVYCWLPILNTGTVPVDSDNDGMPNDWELALCLNPHDPNDANDYRDGDGYTNIEEYINWLPLKEPMPSRANVNCDGTVNLYDFSEFAEHYGSSFGTALYDEKCDFNSNGVISIDDLFYIALDWLWCGQD